MKIFCIAFAFALLAGCAGKTPTQPKSVFACMDAPQVTTKEGAPIAPMLCQFQDDVGVCVYQIGNCQVVFGKEGCGEWLPRMQVCEDENTVPSQGERL